VFIFAPTWVCGCMRLMLDSRLDSLTLTYPLAPCGGCSGHRDGRLHPSPAVERSGNFDFDLLRLGLLGLAQVHGQHAVFELGADLAGAVVIREREVAHKTAVGPFDAVILLAFLFL